MGLAEKISSLNKYLNRENEIRAAQIGLYGPKIQQYMQHARQNFHVRPDSPYIKNRIGQLPVCPRCERVGLRHTRKDNTEQGRKQMVCPECHYEGPYTVTVREYVDKLLFR
jgi:hypothetical protein